jgi:hypothetical protein
VTFWAVTPHSLVVDINISEEHPSSIFRLEDLQDKKLSQLMYAGRKEVGRRDPQEKKPNADQMEQYREDGSSMFLKNDGICP